MRRPSRLGAQRIIVELACTVTDRSDDQQLALLAAAAAADQAANDLGPGNHRRGPAWRLVALAASTRRNGPSLLAPVDAERFEAAPQRWDRHHRLRDRSVVEVR